MPEIIKIKDMEANMDHKSLQEAGSALGSAAVIVVNSREGLPE